ncbi:hypothetical protein [Krasilnikovia sp. M28-CT-15]|uniref:hypothetical protein n=1 Tax=Krasilnikovia sp. M28-CT-15 TaxID=3373540 RepID=UPI0038767E85
MSATDAPAPSTSTPPAGTPRWVWILIFALSAIIVGGTAGLLAHSGGASVPGSILTGGGAFAGTLGLLLATAHFAAGK